ncbi:response regulator [Telmatocola sphagniphila]|uniref:Response regulator n=1 Tax=Telmatocola sphagniphila TaxID=1123043 RepID=A0A8E6BAW7_9BACT|nr:response regulator [Telmatocola sphagniphila]QVL34494.1 response regulator [Telmatocola sphagniphila]
MAETILIVDDEDSVRKTFGEWLKESSLPIHIKAVSDAEAALQFANENTIDLAILDWNLGSGSDGLQLLEDLVVFQPNVIAILVTGFAHQATPLQALRMGVRDYLDKNQDLTRDSFLKSVRKQLDLIRPAKQQRQFQKSLLTFREAIEKALPLVQSSATLQSPGSPVEAFKPLIQIACYVTSAQVGYLVLRHLLENNREELSVTDQEGKAIPWQAGPFAKTIAASALMNQRTLHLQLNSNDVLDMIQLQPFEKEYLELMAIPLSNDSRTQAVLELAKPSKVEQFTAAAKPILNLLQTLGGELVRRTVADQRQNQLLLAALQTARQVSDQIARGETVSETPAVSPHVQVVARMQETLASTSSSGLSSRDTLRLAQRIRDLSDRFGAPALKYADQLLELTEKMLAELNPPLRD